MSNEELVSRIQNGDDAQGHMLELWRQNKGLIATIAIKYSGYEDIEDLKQQGYIGLCQAVANYNPDERTAFASYAVIWIRQSVHRYVEECGSVIRVPDGLMCVMLKYKRLTAYMLSNYGRKPTDTEAMELLGISGKRLEMVRYALKAKDIKSLNTTVGDGEPVELLEIVRSDVDVEGEVLDRVQLEELKQQLWGMVGRLPREQRHVLKERYANNRVIKDIADDMGDTLSHTKHNELKALNALRHGRGSARLQSFLPEYCNPLRGCGVSVFNTTWTSSTEHIAVKLVE